MVQNTYQGFYVWHKKKGFRFDAFSFLLTLNCNPHHLFVLDIDAEGELCQ